MSKSTSSTSTRKVQSTPAQSTTAKPGDQIKQKSPAAKDSGDAPRNLSAILSATRVYAAVVGNRIGVVSLDESTVESYIETFNEHRRSDAVPAVAIEGRIDAQDPAVETFLAEQYWITDEAGIVVFRGDSRFEAVTPRETIATR